MRCSKPLGADHTATPNRAEQLAQMQMQMQVLQLQFNKDHVQLQFNARNASHANPTEIAQNEAEMQVLQTKMNALSKLQANGRHYTLNIYEAKPQAQGLTFQLHLQT